MTSTACLLAAALVLSHAAMLSGVVVCIGADGHVDVELVLDGCCVTALEHGGAGAGDLMQSEQPCGDCVDLELRVVFTNTRDSQPGPANVLYASRSCTPGSDPRNKGLPSAQVDQHWRSLETIATVVLLT